MLEKKQDRSERTWQFNYKVLIRCEKQRNATAEFFCDQIFPSEHRQMWKMNKASEYG